MERYPFYTAGNFSTGDSFLDITNPYTGQSFARAYQANEKALETAITGAQNMQPILAVMPSHQRSTILSTIADNLYEERDAAAALLSLEAGKPLRLALGEVDRAIQTFRIAAEECKRLPMEYIQLDWTPAGNRKEGLVKPFPVGVVAGIVPFNFPLNLAVHKIAPALATGCPIIIKPASGTPLSCLNLARIINNTSLPKGAFSVLPLNRELGNRLVTDERIKLLSFTGSPEVGWKMKANAGKKKVILELGGNAGLIVTASANINDAVVKAVSGGFAYSGQVCIHTQRILVDQKIFDNFTEKFLEEVSQLKNGNPLDPATTFSVMIDETNAKRVEAWVNEAVAEGATILTGGKRDKAWYAPTVITNTRSKMKVCAAEVFGPVVTLEPYGDFTEAVHEVNNSRYGLQAGVFTNAITEMNYAFEHIEAGGIIINDVPTFRVDHMPYGGVKDSGMGREGVKYAMHEMMEPKILVKNF